jgi:hypothetical protein
MQKAVVEIVFGAVLLAIGVLMILFVSDFTPQYIGGSIVVAFGAVSVTSGIIGLAKK